MAISYLRTLGVAGFGVLLATAAIVSAQPDPNAHQQKPQSLVELFARADGNHDGKLTPDELPDADMFKKFDVNADGAITLEEARAAQAKPAPPTPEERFKRLDKNADGKLTLEEVPEQKFFQRLDKNVDGVVTLEEFTAGMPKPGPAPQPGIEAQFKAADKNGDGKLTPDEVPDANIFKRLDRNADGAISLDEARAAAANEQKPPQPSIEAHFKAADKNGDGKITPDEVQDVNLFNILDKNADGVITLDEARATQPKPAQPQATPEEKFKQADKNADGKLTPDEVPDAKLFAKLDANADGAITLEELKAAMAHQPQK